MQGGRRASVKNRREIASKKRLDSVRFCILLVIGLFTNAVSANDCRTINAIASYDWFPVAFQSPKDRTINKGIAIEVVQEIAKDLDIKLTVDTTIPWSRGIMYMNTGKVDMLIGHYNSQERTRNWLISQPLFEEDIRAFFHVDNEHKVTSPEDLYLLLGVYPRGASYGDEIDFIIKNKMKAHEYSDGLSMLGAIIKKRYDFAISAKMDIDSVVSKLGIGNMIMSSNFSLGKNNVHFAFARKSPCAHMFNAFNQKVPDYVTPELTKIRMERATNDYFAEQDGIPEWLESEVQDAKKRALD